MKTCPTHAVESSKFTMFLIWLVPGLKPPAKLVPRLFYRVEVWQQARLWKTSDILLNKFVFLDDASTVRPCNVILEQHGAQRQGFLRRGPHITDYKYNSSCCHSEGNIDYSSKIEYLKLLLALADYLLFNPLYTWYGNSWRVRWQTVKTQLRCHRM